VKLSDQIEFAGRTLPLWRMARLYYQPSYLVKERLETGWPIDQALMAPAYGPTAFAAKSDTAQGYRVGQMRPGLGIKRKRGRPRKDEPIEPIEPMETDPKTTQARPTGEADNDSDQHAPFDP